ncbi:MAG TPA: leucyl aminopeptidase [Planctomycetota bacterium]|nr:leucyl aminopeptidase [Planctomycetota bacterium]
MYQSIRIAAQPTPHPDVIVCLIFDDKTLHHCDQDLDARHHRILSSAIKRGDVKGENGEITVVQSMDGSVFALLGLGKRNEFSADRSRSAAGRLAKSLHKLEAKVAQISVPKETLATVDVSALGCAIGEGIGLGNFKFDEHKRPPKDEPAATELAVHVFCAGEDAKIGAACVRGLELAESANFARRLAATPPNVATTEFIAKKAQELARDSGLKCKIIDGSAAEKLKLVGIENVGKASIHKPCLIELSYTPRGKSPFTLLLIGKTICFDTGGLSIKPREGMRGMKYDKCGGMAVLGAMREVARIKPNFRVVGLLPTAENSIAHNALRVDDILHYPNGVSVEVTNTDAEGRLVLADALIYGVKEHKPAAVVDLATLTGGVVVGLGRTYAGYFCSDDKLRARLENASEASGERIWRLPMHEDYKELMKAKHADIWNSAPMREAHPIQGAAFLSNFIDAAVPWAHIDIAGTADLERDKAPFVAGPTGFGVRLLANLVAQWK